jgi:hypothetical protein
MARPMAASAAATVNTNKQKTCPDRSDKWALKATKFMFTAKRISSIDIRIPMMFFLFRKTPNVPRANKIADKTK